MNLYIVSDHLALGTALLGQRHKVQGMNGESASQLAHSVIGHLSDRWLHVSGVAMAAVRASAQVALAEDETRNVVAGAWLHDVGYGVPQGTEFHPLDGARYLRDRGIGEPVLGLVAYHSNAEYEARERGLSATLRDEFAPPDPWQLAVLTYCDLRTNPRGEVISFEDRIRDIEERYGPEHLVTRAILASAPEMRARIRQVEDRIAEVQSQ